MNLFNNLRSFTLGSRGVDGHGDVFEGSWIDS